MESKELLVINPLLYSDMNKYIWISESFQEYREAQRLFDYLMKKNIYISGFATDEKSLVDLRMYNKKIFDINTLSKECSIVFYDSYFGCSNIDISDKACMARIVNQDLVEMNCVIWGSGKTGERVYQILKNAGIKVNCFVDSNTGQNKMNKCGLPIYSPDQLEECMKDFVIIEAMEKWRELDKCIQEKYVKRFHYNFESSGLSQKIFYNDGVEKKDIFCLSNFWMFHYFVGRKIYVYGWGGVKRNLLNI